VLRHQVQDQTEENTPGGTRVAQTATSGGTTTPGYYSYEPETWPEAP